MHIKPLNTLTPAEVTDLAHAAADRGEPLDAANPYAAGSARHDRFAAAYRKREGELQAVAATPMEVAS
jgi:hypothetical protein